MAATSNLSIRESKRRTMILNGNLWKTVFWITTPLAIYALFNYFYGFIDFLLVSTMGTADVATVFFIEDIKGTISAIGGGIAIGGAVFVARHYGANDLESARKNAGQTLVLALSISIIIAILVMLLALPILKLFNAPDEIIATGLGYYLVQMASTVVIAVNSVYMGIERSKGNTTMVMLLNIIAMIIKLILSTVFVLVLHKGIIFVGYATLIAQLFLMVLGIIILFNKKNSIAIRLKNLKPDKTIMKAILIVAIPVIGGKFFFSLGRVIVNGIAAIYGTIAIAAFGLASKLAGGPGAIAGIFEESTASIASQNIGAGHLKRSFKAYLAANTQAVIVGFIGMFIVVLSIDTMIPWFTSNSSPEFATLAKQIFAFEKFSIVTGATTSIVAALFIGFKISKVTLILNLLRIYVFRIPVLLLFIHFGIGPVALGYVMFVSNTSTALVAIIFIYLFYRRVKHYGYLDLRYQDSPQLT
jgi:putative MATE family efflux protein